MGKKVALLIGVSNYGLGLTPLRSPTNGVKAMERILENPEIGNFDEIEALIDPSLVEMRSRIEEVFSALTNEDLLLFYFAGHGIKHKATGDFYLATSESCRLENKEINLGTTVESEFVRKALRGSYAERKVVILDCCFAAAFADGFLTMDDDSVEVGPQIIETQELGGKGVCVLTASTSTQYALEQEGEDLSVYTRYLIKGLETGGAALDGKTCISVRDLHNYVVHEIKIAAPLMNPYIYNAREGNEIAISKAYVDNLQRYRKRVQEKVSAGKGHLRPTAITNLEILQRSLKISLKQAEEVQRDATQPYREREENIKLYRKTLIEEKEYGYPLHEVAVNELQELKNRLNLRDEDVKGIEDEVIDSDEPMPSFVASRAEELTKADSEELSGYSPSLLKRISLSFISSIPWIVGSLIIVNMTIGADQFRELLQPFSQVQVREAVSESPALKESEMPIENVAASRAEQSNLTLGAANTREEVKPRKNDRGSQNHFLRNTIIWTIYGLISGAVARAIYPGHQGLGIIGTMTLGVIGAAMGGVISSLIVPSSTVGSSISAVLGSICMLFIYYAVTTRTA